MTELTEAEQRLVRVLSAVLEQQGSEQGIDSQLHAEHHRAVAQWIQKENQKRERWEKITQSAVGSLIVAAISGLAAALIWIAKLALAGAQAAQHTTGGNLPPGH
jgi:hypothetical protein